MSDVLTINVTPENENKAILHALIELIAVSKSINGKLAKMIAAELSPSEANSLLREYAESHARYVAEEIKKLNWNYADAV